MSQEVRRRNLRTIQFSANNKVTEQLSRGMVYRELYIRLQGKPTVTGANNTQAKTKRGDEWSIIKRIDLVANNTDVIRSISGVGLYWLNYFLYGKGSLQNATLGDGSTANPAIDSHLILPLWSIGTIRPMDTALDARQLSDLKIEITWGTYTDLNGDATAWTTEPTVEINSLESFNVKGPFSQWRIYTIEKAITASNEQFQIQLPVGPMYRGFMMNFTDADVDDVAILNNFKLKSGSTVYADIPAEVLQDVARIRGPFNQGYDHNDDALDEIQRSDSSAFGGWYFYDHVSDGYLSEAIDTLGFSEFELELDVTVGSGTTKAFIWPLQIYPVRGKK